MGKFKKLFIPLIAFVVVIVLIFLPEIIGIKTIDESDFLETESVVSENVDSNSAESEAVERSSKEKKETDSYNGLGRKIGGFLASPKKKTKSNKEERVSSTSRSQPQVPKRRDLAVFASEATSSELANRNNRNRPRRKNSAVFASEVKTRNNVSNRPRKRNLAVFASGPDGGHSRGVSRSSLGTASYSQGRDGGVQQEFFDPYEELDQIESDQNFYYLDDKSLEKKEWLFLFNRDSQGKLRRILRAAGRVNRQLQNTPETSLALKSFIDNLELLIVDKKSEIPKDKKSAKKIINNIEKADLSTLTAMLQEKVARKVLFSWYKIDLSEFYESERVTNFKSVAVAGFNPALQIHSVNYFLTPDAWQGLLSEVKKLEVNVVMLKDGISGLKLYHNNSLVQELIIKYDRLNLDWSYASFVIEDLSGIYRLEVIDQIGNRSVKSYSFSKPYARLVSTDLGTTPEGESLKSVHVRDNFKNNVNVMDRLYTYNDPVTKEVLKEFPDGKFEAFK